MKWKLVDNDRIYTADTVTQAAKKVYRDNKAMPMIHLLCIDTGKTHVVAPDTIRFIKTTHRKKQY